MMDPLSNLRELELGPRLDRRVRRVIRMEVRGAPRPEDGPPYLPLERAFHALVLAAYVVYATVGAASMLGQTGSRREAAHLQLGKVTPRGRMPRLFERASCPSWPRRWSA